MRLLYILMAFAFVANLQAQHTDGLCKVDCLIDHHQPCPTVIDPVCGCDGVTYQNTCHAIQYGGITQWTTGPCDDACIDSSQIDIHAVCPTIYDPVCGCDGVTYPNACRAYYYGGVTSWTHGECTQICVDSSMIDLHAPCTDHYDPVCGCNGVTYSNECHAQYYGGVTSWTDGACDTACVDSSQIDLHLPCTEEYEPVCGCNGVTYDNACHAIFYGGVTEWTDGPCHSNCVDTSQIDLHMNCPHIFQPVCGCDGVTYGNECEAYYYGGVTEWTDGPCHDTCIDHMQIDSTISCPGIYDPVCGCDSITYANECIAYNYGGVTSWTDGECDHITSIQKDDVYFDMSVFPNPATGHVTININSIRNAQYRIQIFNTVGKRLIDRTRVGSVVREKIHINAWPASSYIILINTENTSKRMYFVKQ